MAHRTALYAIRRPVTRLFNPLSKRFAGFLPGFGILTHRGSAGPARSTGPPSTCSGAAVSG